MKTLILIFALAAFNMSFAITEQEDCGFGDSSISGSNKGNTIEVSADASSTPSSSAISIEQ